MTRNSAGTYTTPSNSVAPAVEGTEIDEGDFNTLIDDIEAALTDSLDRTGKGKITAYIDFDEIASPSSPASNVGRLFVKDVAGVTTPYFRDSAGTETSMLGGGGGGGSVATDAIFDAKGDLPGGTGANTAARLPIGTDGQVLTADSAETTGMKWATPSGGSGSVATDTIWDAKGDIAGGTGSNTAARLAVGTDGQFLTADSAEATGMRWATLSGGGDAVIANPLSQFAATTSAQLAGVMTDETGTGALVFANSPTLVTPALGTPASGVLTNCTGLPTAGLVNDAVTYAKIQNVSATDRLLGRSTAGAGDVEEITCTAAGRAILDDATAAAQLTTLGALGQGLHSIFIPAGAMISRTTNGAAVGTLEMTTNKNMLRTLDFDATTQEFAQFEIQMPKSWDEGTITYFVTWSHPATTTNFGVVWSLAGVAMSDNETADVAFGTAVTLADTGGTTNNRYQTSISSAVTIGGTPAAVDLVQFQLARAPADASDTMAVDARLHGLTILYTINAATDA
jgi:hypothetical protein